jgi:chromosome segregation ATPase
MKQIRILMAVLLVIAFSVNQKAIAQSKKPEVKEKIEKEERVMKEQVKEERKEMKEEMQEKKEEMKTIKEAHKEEIKEIKQDYKAKTEAMKDQSDDDGAMRDNQGQKEKAKMKSNNGNAYGQNKEGLVGREFGQARAAEAREQIKNHKMELQESETKIITFRERLEAASKRFEKERAANEISDEAYALRKQKIENAKEKLRKAEQTLNRNRDVVDAQNKKILSLFEKE